MRIDTFFDLYFAWRACTTLGKIFFSWLLVLGWIMLLLVSFYLNCIINFGRWAGFLQFDESEEDETPNTGS
jgi:glucan phosphoethanolaminetransferase (alkaline phosphatase superfamily)